MENYKAKIICVVFVAIVFIMSCSVRRSEPFRGVVSLEKESVRKGQIVYMEYCDKCHPGGESGLGPAVNIVPAPGFIKRFQVRHGLGAMPSFKKGQISEEELKDMMAYLKALRHNKKEPNANKEM